MPSKYELCQQCGSMLKTDVCLKCGFDPEAEKKIPDENIEEIEEFVEVQEDENNEEGHQEVRSIFSEIAASSGLETLEEKPAKKKRKFIAPLILSFILLLIAGASYWRFIYYTPEYVSPLVLSASDIRDLGGAVESTAAASLETDSEINIDLNSQLVEGNFESGNFAQFGSPSIQVFIQAFDIKNVFDRMGSLEIIESLQEEYDVDDDDLSVYFSSGFAYFIPNENLDTWGFAIQVNDAEFIKSRIEAFANNKEDPDYEFSKYFTDLVEVSPKSSDEIVISEGETENKTEEENTEDTEDSEAESSEESENTEESETEQVESTYYLLVSNSNEYLDQMKESSEGNLTNLANEAIFVQAKGNSPKIGEVFVYKEPGTDVWEILAGIAASKYDFVGLDKVLETVITRGSVFYSVDDRLRISLTED